MANNFHDVGGMLIVGIDLHEALLLPGVPPAVFVPIPMPRMPHINFLHPFTMGGNQKATVQFNGRNTVVHWHSPEKLWPHLNLPPFPIDILIPIDILFGAQIAWLPRGSVMIEGETSTCANIYGPMSINLDCWDIANIPSSMIVQPSTVQTSPSLGDYLDGLKAVAIDFAINVAFNAIASVGMAGLARGARGARNAARRAFGREAGDAAAGAAAREAGDRTAYEAAQHREHVEGRLFDDRPYHISEAEARRKGWSYFDEAGDEHIIWPPDGGFNPGHGPGSLGRGDEFDRYGGFFDENGNFHDYGTNVSPVDANGNPYPLDQRSLPAGTENKPRTRYRVKDPNGIETEAGTVAPWFDQPGGAGQHTFPPTPKDQWIELPDGRKVDPNSIEGLLAQDRIEIIGQDIPPPGDPPTPPPPDPTLFD
jgi:hypothetical protein